MKNKINFIIFSFSYNDDSGGTVVLHKLCHLLNEEGYSAKIWDNYKPVFDKVNPIKSIFKYMKYFRKRIRKQFLLKEKWNTPLAKNIDLIEDSIVVYPELVDGNPLNARHVVRWLLHKPGYHSNKINYSKDELIFYYLKSYLVNIEKYDLKNELYIPNNREDTYYNYNNKNRAGTCYILRKGKGREIVHDTNNSILIDGKSHEEIAKIFNETEVFISYDTYTMYSVYAAMCGCVSVVIPSENISKEEWLPDAITRYGLAYGFDHIEESKDTQLKLIDKMNKEESKTKIQLEHFVNESYKVFLCKNN